MILQNPSVDMSAIRHYFDDLEFKKYTFHALCVIGKCENNNKQKTQLFICNLRCETMDIIVQKSYSLLCMI